MREIFNKILGRNVKVDEPGDKAMPLETDQPKESLEGALAEKNKPVSRWHMEPPAKMVIELDLDRMPPSQARGSLLQMDDIVCAFYQEQAAEANKRKNKIIMPSSMTSRTEAILNRRPQ